MIPSVKKPYISEKSTFLSEAGKYVFHVESGAKAKQIKDMVEKLYKVHVVKMNIINVKRGDKGFKKAIVTLKKGEKMDIIPH